IVRPPDDGTDDPIDRLRAALRRVGDDRYLEPRDLASRLQLWSLATVDPAYDAINRDAQRRYLDGLIALVHAANPGLGLREAARRAGEILVVQNGVWLT